VSEGKFRDDLFYRLNVVRIDLPPLSQRREDIPLLIEAFIQKFNTKMGKQITGVSDEVMRTLMRYDYPGNVRELENIIEHAFVLCKGDRIGLDCLPKELSEKEEKVSLLAPIPGENLFDRAEAEIIGKTLKKYGGNRINTAKELGLDRTTLWRKMKRYGLR
jgi:transcriptional regulator with PAS, ATPase and Fis domain